MFYTGILLATSSIIEYIIAFYFFATDEKFWKLFMILAIQFVIGGFFTIKGSRPIMKNYKTAKKGKIAYGIVIDTGIKKRESDGFRYKFAEILTVIDGETAICSEVIGIVVNYRHLWEVKRIGISLRRIKVGDYIKLKYYEDDVNIISRVPKTEIPNNIYMKIENELSKRQSEKEEIEKRENKYKTYINGKPYI